MDPTLGLPVSALPFMPQSLSGGSEPITFDNDQYFNNLAQTSQIQSTYMNGFNSVRNRSAGKTMSGMQDVAIAPTLLRQQSTNRDQGNNAYINSLFAETLQAVHGGESTDSMSKVSGLVSGGAASRQMRHRAATHARETAANRAIESIQLYKSNSLRGGKTPGALPISIEANRHFIDPKGTTRRPFAVSAVDKIESRNRYLYGQSYTRSGDGGIGASMHGKRKRGKTMRVSGPNETDMAAMATIGQGTPVSNMHVMNTGNMDRRNSPYGEGVPMTHGLTGNAVPFTDRRMMKWQSGPQRNILFGAVVPVHPYSKVDQMSTVYGQHSGPDLAAMYPRSTRTWKRGNRQQQAQLTFGYDSQRHNLYSNKNQETSMVGVDQNYAGEGLAPTNLPRKEIDRRRTEMLNSAIGRNLEGGGPFAHASIWRNLNKGNVGAVANGARIESIPGINQDAQMKGIVEAGQFNENNIFSGNSLVGKSPAWKSRTKLNYSMFDTENVQRVRSFKVDTGRDIQATWWSFNPVYDKNKQQAESQDIKSNSVANDATAVNMHSLIFENDTPARNKLLRGSGVADNANVDVMDQLPNKRRKSLHNQVFADANNLVVQPTSHSFLSDSGV